MNSELLWLPSLISPKDLIDSYSQTFLITDQNIYSLYRALFESVQDSSVHMIILPPGESSKTRRVKEEIENELFRKKAQKNTLLVAIGGGVISDLVGFVAATYFRGVDWIAVPTTLTGMIDAAHGGKTGINTDYGKNTIGSFYTPKKIIICPLFLKTLSPPDMENGFAESIKYGCLANLALLESRKMYDTNPIEFIQECIEIKTHFTEKDPYDTSIRKHLNFGHTIGHALESAFDYKISHGRCVAMGIHMESLINVYKGHLNLSDYEKIIKSLNSHFQDLPWDKIPDPHTLYSLSQRDKKNDGNSPQISIIKTLGNVESQKTQFTQFSKQELTRSCTEVCNGHLC